MRGRWTKSKRWPGVRGPNLNAVISSKPQHGVTPAEEHATFFRQGSWLILATGLSGALMLGTQLVAQRWMVASEYLVFFVLLRFYLFLGVPSLGLQTVFVQETAAAVTAERRLGLAGSVRSLLRATFYLWLGVVAVAVLAQGWLLDAFKIPNAGALWATIGMGLGCLWGPILKGVLQGRQSFLGLGAVIILDGAGRLIAVTVILLFGGQAAGGMAGALLGLTASVALCAWLIRDLFRGRAGAFAWTPWLRRLVPITFGAGTVLLFTTADVMYVHRLFPEAEQLYMPAAMVGLALMVYSMPIAQVMFPKVARSAAVAGKSHAMVLALLATGAGGAAGALVCTAFPELPLRLVYFSKPTFWAAAPLVPWFAWALLPLTLANVLINSLLAREEFQVVPWVVAVGALWLAALVLGRSWLVSLEPLTAFRCLLSLTGLCGLLLLVAAARFTARETGLPTTDRTPGRA